MNKNSISLVLIAAAIVVGLIAWERMQGENEVQPQSQPLESPGESPETGENAACRDFTEARLTVEGGATLSVAIAETPEERSLGLGGCESLPEGTGMYFPYETPTETAYWMKGMVMPIDIVWIRQGKVIGIEESVPSPANLDVPTSELEQYHSPEPVDGVLEIRAGSASRYGIHVGSTLGLQ